MGLVGAAGDEREQLLDELLAYSQSKEGGLLGTFKHVSDGQVPQSIMAFTPGGVDLEQSRLQQLVQGAWKREQALEVSDEREGGLLGDSFLSRFV